MISVSLASCNLARKPSQPGINSVAQQREQRLATAFEAEARGDAVGAAFIYRQLAYEGIERAQVELAQLYLRGAGVPRDPYLAGALLQQAMAAGSAIAPRILGDLYLDGEGVPTDPGRARGLFEEAARRGDDLARLRLATLTLASADSNAGLTVTVEAQQAAAAEIESLARDGLLHAQLTLADLYHDGKVKPRDTFEAARWYAVAIEPLRAEAQSGDARAFERLGDMYRDGKGVVAEGRVAAHWYEKAANAGRAPALMRLVRLYEKGAPGLTASSVHATRWLRLAVDRGDRTAMYDLARHYLNGDGVDLDKTEALQLFERAASLGETRSYRWIGEIHDDPEGPVPDVVRAAEWYSRAAENGDGKAMFKLAELYERGRLEPPDAITVALWYRRAAEHGYERGAERFARAESRLSGTDRRRLGAALERSDPEAQQADAAAVSR